MRRRIIIDSKIEWESVIDKLELHNIPYNIVEDEYRNEIILLERYYASFVRLVGDKYASEIISESKSSGMKMPYKIVLMAYAIIATLLFAKYYFAYWRISENSNKNYTYEWSSDNTILTFKHKDQDIGSRYFDKNHDKNYERIEEFSNNLVFSVSIDSNEDGLEDEVLTYSVNGQLVASLKYSQSELWLSQGYQVFEGGRKFFYTDTNRNGLLEIREE
ncbi:MAG: hypothetical protein K1X55_17705 [Chitinophagales bacterium]|nr:hypothetical protein [Chitinophagales bacterium]